MEFHKHSYSGQQRSFSSLFDFLQRRRDIEGRDLTLLILIFLFTFLGFTMLFPISSVVGLRIHEDANYYVKKQFLALLVGIAGFLFAASISFSWMFRNASLILIGSLLGLILVFIPGIGRSVQTSQGEFSRWLNLGIFSIQPSEIAKITLINYLAASIMKFYSSAKSANVSKIVWPIIFIFSLFILILLEPQYGTMICMILGCVTVLYLSGFSLRKMFSLSILFVPILIALAVFSNYRSQRLTVWLDPYQYRYEGGYQLVTSFLAYKNAKLFGNDLATGFAHRYLTFGHTDFVLPLLIENFGLLGFVILLLLYIVLVCKIFRLLVTIEDGFTYLFVSGLFCILCIQTLMNMFMATGLLPTTGISLPFFSFGGSGLVTSLIMMGFIYNASRYSNPSSKKPLS